MITCFSLTNLCFITALHGGFYPRRTFNFYKITDSLSFNKILERQFPNCQLQAYGRDRGRIDLGVALKSEGNCPLLPSAGLDHVHPTCRSYFRTFSVIGTNPLPYIAPRSTGCTLCCSNERGGWTIPLSYTLYAWALILGAVQLLVLRPARDVYALKYEYIITVQLRRVSDLLA